MLGNLYYDQRWWSVAMDDYADAIKKNAAYRNNPTLNRNVIRMLAAHEDPPEGDSFLRGTIGHRRAIVPPVRGRARDNPIVRKQAAAWSRFIR